MTEVIGNINTASLLPGERNSVCTLSGQLLDGSSLSDSYHYSLSSPTDYLLARNIEAKCSLDHGVCLETRTTSRSFGPGDRGSCRPRIRDKVGPSTLVNSYHTHVRKCLFKSLKIQNYIRILYNTKKNYLYHGLSMKNYN